MVSKQFIVASCLSLVLSVLAGCAGNEGGGCPTPCASAEVCCDGMCVLTTVSQQHCGGCGQVCSGVCSGGVCMQSGVDASSDFDAGMQQHGACRPTCASSQMCCGTSCVEESQPLGVDGRPSSSEDPRSPFNNCNGCGFRCDPERANSCSIRSGSTEPSCSCGNLPQCPAGDVCVQGSTGFQCVNLSTSTENCGEIGNRCAEGELCSGGVCGCGGGASCAEGQACCSGSCVDVTSDAANCGACGNACGANAPNCQAGTCVCGTGPEARACTAPMAGTGFPPVTSLGESCCDGLCVANSDTSCGCGVACDTASDETCIVTSGGGLPIPGTPTSGEATVCCGEEIPILGGFCTGGGPGIPGFGDGGLPFP